MLDRGLCTSCLGRNAAALGWYEYKEYIELWHCFKEVFHSWKGRSGGLERSVFGAEEASRMPFEESVSAWLSPPYNQQKSVYVTSSHPPLQHNSLQPLPLITVTLIFVSILEPSDLHKIERLGLYFLRRKPQREPLAAEEIGGR